MNKEKIQELEEQLKALNETELCSLFYQVVAPWKKVREDFGEVDDAYCITISGYSDRDGVHGSFFWALPKEPLESFSMEEYEKGATQSGECSRCHAEVTCISKVAICPICGTEVECT